MWLYDYLLEMYGYDNPIIIDELKINGYSTDSIKQLLYLLEKERKIERYSQEIYYIARDTLFGKSKLIFEDVLKKKYIEDNENIYGYYTGIYFKNILGLTTQMVNTPEIVSNKEFSKKRAVMMCGRNAIVRKSHVKITRDNAKILQFFDLFQYLTLNEVEKYRKVLVDYIKFNSFTKKMVDQYLSLFSEKVNELMIKSGLIYEFV